MQVLALAVPFPGDPTKAELKTFRQRHKLTYPLLGDPNGAIATRFEVTELPANFILNRQGKLIGIPEGVPEIVSILKKLTK